MELIDVRNVNWQHRAHFLHFHRQRISFIDKESETIL
jgi:hypothetical protein